MKSLGRVAMLMSGGVDSSVSAALLKEQGYEVIGFYILGWLGTPEFPCPWQSEERDAKAVADVVGIPFHTINLSKEYEQAVIDEFFKGYQAGLTPNPDILCNREIKFKAFWHAIRQFEPDFVATGHYARCQQTANSHQLSVNGIAESRKPKADSWGIFVPKDSAKDQTYFLWGIESTIVPQILFPLGDLDKSEVRKLAKKFNLPTAAKKDSQGICFVGPLKVRQFIASKVSTKPGIAVLKDGRPIAKHDGVELYTIGQRLAVGSVDWSGDVPPLFVMAKDLKNNLLIVGSDSECWSDALIAGSLNWLSGRPPQDFEGQAKIRYRQDNVEFRAEYKGEMLIVSFSEPVRAITAGQSIVFYSLDGQRLLGGGIIETVQSQDEIIERLPKPEDSTKK